MPEWARPLPGEEGDAPAGASGAGGTTGTSGSAGTPGAAGTPVAGSGAAPRTGRTARPTAAAAGGRATGGSSSLARGSSRSRDGSNGSSGRGGFGQRSSSGFGSSGLSGGFGSTPSKRRAGGSRRKEYSGERKERTPRPTVADRVESDALAGAELTEHAREAILRTLTAAPKSRRQLMDAMTRKGYPPEVLEPILDRFEEVGLVDDAEYAGMIVRTRHGERGLSRRAIAQELRRKGIDDDTATGALDQVDEDDEAEAARDLVRRRLARTTGLDREVRTRRIVGMLARKGYSPSLALTLVREEIAREGEQPDDDEPFGGFDDL
ncbi:regulatory protein RecX [Oerskovia turbata]|uniref:Regulatory protein RecX n=1 Tax=Oerskovia turbata TaxID=1713 RepID=A0A4Q1KZD7_9CELL|nr:regulatory protein RecX [Oerskovia turbata]RXR27840.1 regulatory protein RecX [Oerskovia turbata]RXR35722.1 regulatory protein RecX [Oerskovia turbata]